MEFIPSTKLYKFLNKKFSLKLIKYVFSKQKSIAFFSIENEVDDRVVITFECPSWCDVFVLDVDTT
jgi:hypothetical protein